MQVTPENFKILRNALVNKTLENGQDPICINTSGARLLAVLQSLGYDHSNISVQRDYSISLKGISAIVEKEITPVKKEEGKKK